MNVPMRCKIFDLFLNKIKKMKTVEAFKVAVTKRKPQNWLCRLCKCYLPGITFIWHMLWNFIIFKENIIYLRLCFAIGCTRNSKKYKTSPSRDVCARTERRSSLTSNSENLHFCSSIEEERSSEVQGIIWRFSKYVCFTSISWNLCMHWREVQYFFNITYRQIDR